MTKIEWTDSTWNPIVGCSIVSPGCTNCYAMKMAARLERMGNAPQYNGTTQPSRAGAVWTGKVALAENALLEPLKRKKPTMYFVNSMGDLFHEDVPDEWIDHVFAVMALCPQHTFQVLTKRSARMREYITNAFDRLVMAMIKTCRDHDVPTVKETCEKHDIPWKKPKSRDDWWPLGNVWLGVSAEDQARADERILDLLGTPATIRFISAEPLLGPLDLNDVCNGHYFQNYLTGNRWHDGPIANFERFNSGLDWVICGGESGAKARPMHPKWAKSLRDQCQTAGTAFFFKQWGEWQPYSEYDEIGGPALHNEPPEQHPEASTRSRFDAICMDSDGTQYDLGKKGQLRQAPIGAFAGPNPMSMHRIGKKAAGRMLDGREWNEVPT